MLPFSLNLQDLIQLSFPFKISVCRALQEKNAEFAPEDFKQLEAQQRQLSLNNNFFLKEYEQYLNQKIEPLKKQFESLSTQLDTLRNNRRDGSHWLQDWLFDEYNFLNSRKEFQNVKDLFKARIPDVPPAGSLSKRPHLHRQR